MTLNSFFRPLHTKTLNSLLCIILLLLLVSCNQPSSSNTKPINLIDVSGVWTMVITKSNGTKNYASVRLTQDTPTKPEFKGRLVFQNINTSVGVISGNVSTGAFRIGEEGQNTYIDVSGRFTQNNYSGSYTAHYSNGVINQGTLTMKRYIPSVSISITPAEVTLERNKSHQFSAEINNAKDNSVTWKSSCGTINSVGKYTAPNVEGTCEITVTSVEDSTKSAVAKVTVSGPDVEIAIAPQEVAIEVDEEQNFTVTVTGSDNKNVTWEVSGGTIEQKDNTVVFTAPSAVGIYTLTATSQDDPLKQSSAKHSRQKFDNSSELGCDT